MSLLIRNQIQLRALITFSGDLEYDTLVPALRSAQTQLARYVGEALLTELETQSPSAEETALLPYVLAPIANLAMLKFMGTGNVRITDLGVMRTKSENTSDAFEWQLDRAVTALQQEAFDGIEALLRYLERNLATFPSYANSAAYRAESGRLISSAEVFNQYYEIGSSRLVLQTLSAAMRTSEVRTIRPLLGIRLVDLLVGSSLTIEQAVQLDAARRALVYLTIARALREKLVSISDQGVQVSGISQTTTTHYKQPASDKQLERSIAYFDGEAAQFLSDLVTLLQPVPTIRTLTGSRVTGTSIVAF